MTGKLIKLAVVACAFSFGACVHSEADKTKSSYESVANTRIKKMDKQIEDLEKKEAQQLPGEPRQQLTSAVDNLKQKADNARAELKELDNREASNWIEKKGTVDQSLYDMDQAYSDALRVLQAH